MRKCSHIYPGAIPPECGENKWHPYHDKHSPNFRHKFQSESLRDLGRATIVEVKPYGHPANNVLQAVIETRPGERYAFRFLAEEWEVEAANVSN